PLYEPAGEGAQRRRSPGGGWDKWLDEITAQQLITVPPFQASLDSVFRSALQAAEQGNIPAQAAVAMLDANGRGVQQNYAEAGKWWIKAAEGGDLKAARHVWNLYRNGEGVERNAAIANQWAKVIGEPVQVPRTTPRTTAAPGPR